MAETSYHHGNLRQSLINIGISHLKEKGAEKISLRALAREIGVSQTAPYRHFHDKKQLLAAIAVLGFTQLAEQTETEKANLSNPMEIMRAMAHSYISFAVNNAEIFKIMFGPALGDRKDYPDVLKAAKSRFEQIENVLRESIADGTIADLNVTLVANSIWASIHGLAILLQDRYDRFPGLSAKEQIDNTLDILINGLEAKQPTQAYDCCK